MKDYKSVMDQKFRRLEKDIHQTMKEFKKLEKKKTFSLPKHFVAWTGGCAALISLCIFAGYAFSHSAKVQTGSSFIGQVKIKEEFAQMSNPEAVGGAEYSVVDTNSSELKFFFYKIKKGESLITISKKLGVSMDTLISLNTMDNVHSLGEGQKILVPNLQGILYLVKSGDSIEGIAKKYSIQTADIMDANDLEDSSLASPQLNAGEILFLPGASLSDAERAKALGYFFIKPVFGKFTSGFGIRRDPFSGGAGYHAGIDIAAAYGTPIRSAKEGRVVFTGWHGGYGKCVIVRHQYGFETVYGHLSSIQVRKDSWVKQGQLIARMGSTGRSTGSHLHFEVRKYGRPVNPLRQSGLSKSRGRWYQ